VPERLEQEEWCAFARPPRVLAKARRERAHPPGVRLRPTDSAHLADDVRRKGRGGDDVPGGEMRVVHATRMRLERSKDRRIDQVLRPVVGQRCFEWLATKELSQLCEDGGVVRSGAVVKVEGRQRAIELRFWR